MNTLFLTQTDARGASARLRVYQYLEPLARLGIRAEVWPLPLGNAYSRSRFVRGALYGLHFTRRLADMTRVGRFDVIVIQRDLIAHLVPWLEEMLARVHPRIVLDVDDPIHLHPPTRPPAWPFRLFWDPRKLERLSRLAGQVVVANRFLRDEVAKFGVKSSVIPTSIDTRRWTPGRIGQEGRFVIGWIGSPGTTGYLARIAPALDGVARQIPCVLRAVGADERLLRELFKAAPDIEIEVAPWSEDCEVDEVRRFDVGVMPLTNDQWSKGKSATKLLQYMACCVPAVASPVGANSDIVKNGVNGLLAGTMEGWEHALLTIARDKDLACGLGREGRATVVSEYDLEVSAPKLARVICEAAAHA